jgi:hypothetical protein
MKLSEGKCNAYRRLVGGSNPSANTGVFQAFHTSLRNQGVLNTKSEILKEFEIQIKVTVSAPSLLKYGIIINASNPFSQEEYRAEGQSEWNQYLL